MAALVDIQPNHTASLVDKELPKHLRPAGRNARRRVICSAFVGARTPVRFLFMIPA